MRNLLIYCSIWICLPSLTAQIEWEALPPHNLEAIDITYAGGESTLVGFLNFPPRILVSADLGKTWSIVLHHDAGFYDGVPGNERFTHRALVVREGPRDKIFIGFENKIYLYDVQTSELLEFLEMDRYWLTDFFVLPNSNTIVLGSNALVLFDKDGKELEEHWMNDFHGKLIPGKNDKHTLNYYSNEGRYLVYFNSDLTEVSAYDEFLLNDNNLFEFQDDRIFGISSYSDDGKDWIPYQNDISGLVSTFGDGVIHILTSSDKLYLSEDNGTTFILKGEINNGFKSIYSSDVWQLKDGGLLYETNLACSNTLIKYSESGYKDFTSVNAYIGHPHATNIEASNSTNIFVNECGDIRYSINSQGQGWQFFEPQLFEDCDYINSIIALEDKSLISSKSLCYSADEGLSWYNNSNWIYGDVYIKSKKTYSIDYPFVHLSNDFGRTWEFKAVFFGDYYSDDFGFSSAENFFFYSSHRFSQIVKTNIEGELISITSSPFSGDSRANLITSYEGDKVFAFVKSRDRELKLMRSLDDGITYEILDLEIDGNYYLDHIDNLYIYNEKEIWLSIDNGDTWMDITPDKEFYKITDMDVSWDGHIYLSTYGSPILRSEQNVGLLSQSSEVVEGDPIIYPNPTTDLMRIHSDVMGQIESYTIYNLDGLEIQRGRLTDRTLNVTSIQNGAYLLHLKDSKGITYFQKIFVLR